MSAIPLAEAKSHLSISDSTHDIALQAKLDAAEAAIVKKCGPLSASSVTERVTGGGSGLVLRTTPVVSLTSVTPVGGSAYTVADLMVDTSAGVVEWVSGSSFTSGRYDVVYSAGRSTLPSDLKLGVLELVRHMWETQRGPTRRPGSQSADGYANSIPGAAHSFPFRVVELISPHIQVGN